VAPTGGLIAITTVLTESIMPEQYDCSHGEAQWYSEVTVEPWLVLPAQICHRDIEARLGHDLVVPRTNSGIIPPNDAILVDLFFEKLALKFK
jgi:hypothetical protein